MNLRLPTIPLAAAAAAALLLPAAASASSVAYVDRGNVWVSSPDGAVKKQLTTDGPVDKPYHLPTISDDGDVTAVRSISGTSTVMTVLGIDGGRLDNVLPWQTGAGLVNFGPFGASVNPTGGQIAYTYGKNHGPYSGYPNGGIENRFAVVMRRAPGSPTNPAIDQGKNWNEPTWIDDKLLISTNGELHYEMQPLQFVHIASFPPQDPSKPSQRLNITRGMVSRAHDRYLLQVRDWNGVEGLYFGTHTGEFPGGQITQACWLPVGQDLDDHWGLSPDGKQVTWADKAGVHVGTFTPGVQNGAVCTGTVTTLSATGKEPSFGRPDVKAPQPDPQPQPDPRPDPQPEPQPQPQPGRTPVQKGTTVTTKSTVRTTATGAPAAEAAGDAELELVVPAAARTAAVRRGLAVRASAPGAGTLSARLGGAGRTLGTARLAVRAAGAYTLKIKLTAAGRKAVRRLKGKKVKLTITFAPKGGGGRLTSTAQVTLK